MEFKVKNNNNHTFYVTPGVYTMGKYYVIVFTFNMNRS
jgi:hypothetical protein